MHIKHVCSILHPSEEMLICMVGLLLMFAITNWAESHGHLSALALTYFYTPPSKKQKKKTVAAVGNASITIRLVGNLNSFTLRFEESQWFALTLAARGDAEDTRWQLELSGEWCWAGWLTADWRFTRFITNALSDPEFPLNCCFLSNKKEKTKKKNQQQHNNL